MSDPKNPLGQFDTYAYHHILIVCDSTDTAEILAKRTEVTTFQHPRNQARYSARTISDNTKSGKYITLIDGMTDARYFITDVRWMNYIADDGYIGEGGIPKTTVMTSDGEITIVEPRGASFLNQITNICDELDTDPVGLVFMLKTIFVGHNATSGYTDMLTHYRPIMFITYDITGVFDNSGAKYKLEFVGLTNGLGKLPQSQKIFEGLSFKIYPTLGETLKNLEDTVNRKYKDTKLKAAKDFAETLTGFIDREDRESAATQFLIDNYREVKYRFVIDEIYENYPAGDVEKSRIKEKLDGEMSVNFGPDVSVEEILNRIMASSSGVLEDSKPDDEKYIYKIISTLRSTVDEYIIEYHIARYQQAISPFTQQDRTGQVTPEEGQSIEFNYIFTGKNVDVKSFDIKMEMGMAFFQIAATSDSVIDNLDGIDSKSVKTSGDPGVAGTGQKLRGRTPLFLGTTLKKPLSRNTTRPVDQATFQALLDRHAALENVAASMIIYGNPVLMDELAILPSEVEGRQTEAPKKDRSINSRWLSVPTLLKVNIKMPKDPNDVNTEYEQFWYSGYYVVLSVENVFSDGEFTQEIGMYSIPKGSELDAVAAKEAEEDAALEEEFERAIRQEESLEEGTYQEKFGPADEQKVEERKQNRNRRGRNRTSQRVSAKGE